MDPMVSVILGSTGVVVLTVLISAYRARVKNRELMAQYARAVSEPDTRTFVISRASARRVVGNTGDNISTLLPIYRDNSLADFTGQTLTGLFDAVRETPAEPVTGHGGKFGGAGASGSWDDASGSDGSSSDQ